MRRLLTEQAKHFAYGGHTPHMIALHIVADRTESDASEEARQIRQTRQYAGFRQIELEHLVHELGRAGQQKVQTPQIAVVQEEQRPERHRGEHLQQRRPRFRRRYAARQTLLDIRPFRWPYARMPGRTVEGDEIPHQREDGRQCGRYVERIRPADGFDEQAGQRPCGHRADGAADEGRREFALLVRRCPFRHEFVQCRIKAALWKMHDGKCIITFEKK